LRFMHMDEVIDDPHGWRQCDTANYIRDFYKNGVDLFHPAVCWMGGYKTLILEFPLPEAIIAELYHVFGPYHVVARIFFLLSFLFSAYYFFKLVNLRFDENVSRTATLIYLLLPLSIFYSRALHIDFFAIGFTLGLVYHFYRGIIEKSNRQLIIGMCLTVIALLVKAPYILAFSCILFPVAFSKSNFTFVLKRVYYFIIPLVIFYLWTHYSNSVNGAAPDWSFITGYRKFDNNTLWYFGSMHQRSVADNWITIVTRIYNECIGGIAGIILFVIGGYAIVRLRLHGILAWSALGLVLYVAVFFNLNIQHNYYQIPFLCLAALTIGAGIVWLATRIKQYANPIAIILVLCFGAMTIWYAEKNYYTLPADQIEISSLIEKNTEENGLVIVSYGGLSVHCPLILYRAHRNGWSIPAIAFDSKIAYKLYKEAGCRYVAIVGNEHLGGQLEKIYEFWQSKHILLHDGQTLHILDFSHKADGSLYNPAEYQKPSK